MPDWLSTLIIVAAPVVASLGTLWLTNRDRIAGERRSHSRDIQDARRERLRALYTEAMAMAVLVTPRAFGYRFPSEGNTDEPAVDALAADRMRARLMVEPEEDEDEILKAFIGVINFSILYRMDESSHAPTQELAKTEKRVRDNMTDLQRICRERLKALEKTV